VTRAVHRRTWASCGLSLAVGTLAVALVASGGTQLTVLGVAVAGLLAFAGGVELRHRGSAVVGGALALGGAGVVGAALLVGYASVVALADQVELLPGMVGLFVLVAGLAAVRSGWERHLITAGTALVLLDVVASGVVHGASATALLAATVATVVAWDVGEQAVNLGEQVGRQAKTRPVELVHGASSVAVGGVGVGLALVVQGGDVTGVPLAGLLLLLAAGVTLSLALYS